MEKVKVIDETTVGQPFPGASSLAFTEQADGEKEKYVVSAEDGVFKVPPGGWEKAGRKYFVIKGASGGTTNDAKIKDIMKTIRLRKGKGFVAKKQQTTLETTVGQKGSSGSAKMSRSRNPLVRLGWKHFKGACFKQIFLKDGGGVRSIPTNQYLDRSVEDIIEEGQRLFFMDGKSKFGLLCDMEVSLGDAQGQIISKFEDVNGNNCNYGQYLKSRGLFSSNCTLYMMTTKKIDGTFPTSDTEKHDNDAADSAGAEATVMPANRRDVTTNEMSVIVVSPTLRKLTKEGAPDSPAISVTYGREMISMYSGNASYLKCCRISQCKDHANIDTLPDDEWYSPGADGFTVSSVVVGERKLLEIIYNETNEQGTKEVICQYPYAPKRVDGIILHHPDEIWGYDGADLIIGIITGYHGEDDDTIRYDWYKDGALVHSGGRSCILTVREAGVYYCQVTHGNFTDTSKKMKLVWQVYASSERSDVQAGPSAERKCPAPDITDLAFAVPEVPLSDLNLDRSLLLGAGTFGKVYKEHWAGSDVAVKEIILPKRSRLSMTETIQKEIMVNTKLRHPNIVQFLATAKDTGGVYLVSEFIKGSNMDDAIFDQDIKKAMGIKPEDKLGIIKQVMQGIAYMHSLRPMVLHRDIKPGNILIKEHCLTTKLCDLGVSRVKSLLAATTTSVGSVPWSPLYMAPECLLGEELSSAASDVWCVGITMIEFFAERDAWNVDQSLTSVDDIKKLMRERKPPLRTDDKVPMEMRSLIDQCTSYDVGKRPPVIDILKSIK